MNGSGGTSHGDNTLRIVLSGRQSIMILRPYHPSRYITSGASSTAQI